MGTHSDYEATDELDYLMQASSTYRSTVYEYCVLAMQDCLSDRQADRMAEIFAEAQSDPLLSFWIDEADHLIAHKLNLINEEFITQQQGKLRRKLRQTWLDVLFEDLCNRTKALQISLRGQGLYAGAIDGIFGPRTAEAVKQLEERSTDPSSSPHWRNNSQGWSIC